MRIASHARVVFLAMGCTVGLVAAPQVPDAALVVERWATAVERHAPGVSDDGLAAILTMTAEDRRLLSDALQAGRMRDAASRLGRRSFVIRAAILHTDAAALRPSAPGAIDQTWNWRFARSLLDLVGTRPADDLFVLSWYHATAAYLLQQGLYAEARAHLDRAAAIMPDRARILFDRACLSEALGLPTAVDSVPSADEANAEAERLFGRAIRADSDLVEARVRRARLLVIRGKYNEADVELRVALASRAILRDRVVGFYAQLFAARAARSLGALEGAANHVRAALALFPEAQSALLAKSELALTTLRPGVAVAAIRELALLPAEGPRRTDPWWVYHLGPGRDADRLLDAMRSSVDAPGPHVSVEVPR